MYRGRKFTEGDAFIGYQKDTPAAVVFQATHQLEREGPAVWERTEPVSVLGPRAVEEEEGEASQVWKENVRCMCVYHCPCVKYVNNMFTTLSKISISSYSFIPYFFIACFDNCTCMGKH